MRTEDLIASLSASTRAVPRHAAERRVAIGLLGGGAVTLALVVGGLGLRPDLPGAMMSGPFMMKWAYTIALAVAAVIVTLHVARPDAGRIRWLWLLAVPIVALGLMAAGEMMAAPASEWVPMWLGHSWRQCSMRVAVLSLPVFAGLLWSFRTLAPTHLRAAGAAAGLAAGASAATIYGLHCPEVSAMFVLTWYSLGMALSAAIGALLGPRLMRW